MPCSAQAIGSLLLELQATLRAHSMPCHVIGMGTVTVLTGSPLSPLTSFVIHQSLKVFHCPFRRQKMGSTISKEHFLPCRRACSYVPVITGCIHAMSVSSQPCNILWGSRYYLGGVADSLLPWVLTANLLLTIFTKPPSCAELHHIIV